MAYKALTFMNLPPDNRKNPGETITEKELKDAGQGDEEIAALIKSGAMGNPDDEINEAHVTEDPLADETNIVDSDKGGEK